eukprot:SAG31_NODE_1066_length_10091_cov_5.779323_1_plen_66_part_10
MVGGGEGAEGGARPARTRSRFDACMAWYGMARFRPLISILVLSVLKSDTNTRSVFSATKFSFNII